MDPEKLEWLVRLSYNWKWHFAVHEHSDVNPRQMRHQESEDVPVSGNREEWTPISDNWWSASRWTDSRWGNQGGPEMKICRGVSHPCGGDYRVCDGVCTHLLPHAHCSATVCRTDHLDTLLTRVRTHARLKDKGMCSAQVVTLHLAFSLLIFHPSAALLSDNLFHTARQSLIFTELLPGLSRPNSAGPVHFRNSEDDFDYMANLPHSTGHGPNQPDKMVPADDDPTPINDPDHDSICEFSKTAHENTGWCGVPTVCESPYPTEHSQEWRPQSTQEERAWKQGRESKGEGLWKQKPENES